jgi:hypothetical protein
LNVVGESLQPFAIEGADAAAVEFDGSGVFEAQ